MARALAAKGALAAYLSGYPKWRLAGSEGVPVRSHSGRTLVTYGLLKFVKHGLRPADHRLFRWQDAGFDRWVSRHLPECDEIHLLPGQSLLSLRAARERGVRTVLNHASGPIRHQSQVLAGEYQRLGLSQAATTGQDEDLLRRTGAEYELAQVHCVASRVVRDQLLEVGIAAERIRIVPYAAEPEFFHPPQVPVGESLVREGPIQLVFAGQVSLRKGLRFLLAALERMDLGPQSRLDIYGPVLPEARPDLKKRAGSTLVTCHGPVSRARLGEVFRSACDALVLPSLEEGFGLVVPQALACGLPCLVSDAVGAADLIQPGVNGEVFRSQSVDGLIDSLGNLLRNRDRWNRSEIAATVPGWDQLAETLLIQASGQ